MINDFKDKLENDGYYHLKNSISKKYIEHGKKYITDKVNYTRIEELIYDGMINTLYDKTGLQLKVVKYRVSNNNNSSDAAGFHRDLQVMNNELNDSIPDYTVLTYLDENSFMELIPGSHKKYRMTILEAIDNYNKYIRLNIKPGDILIFHASMIHRGVFYKTSKNRRLIQCFDCIPYNDYDTYYNKILHLPCLDNCYSNFEILAQATSKLKYVIKNLDFINYFNVATGYNCKSNFIKTLNYKGIEFFSTEANNPRLVPKVDEFDTSNRYIIKANDVRDQKQSDQRKIYFYTMTLFYIYSLIYILIVIIIIFMIVNKTIKKRSLKKLLKKLI